MELRLRDEKHQKELDEIKRQLEAIKLNTQSSPSSNNDDGIPMPEVAGVDDASISSALDSEAVVSVSALSVAAATDDTSEVNLEDDDSAQLVEASHDQKALDNPDRKVLRVTDLTDSGDEKVESDTKSITEQRPVLSADISALSEFSSRPAQQMQNPVSHYHYRRQRPSHHDHTPAPSLGSTYGHHKTGSMPARTTSSSFHHSRHQHAQRLKHERGHGHHHTSTPRKVPQPHLSTTATSGSTSVGTASRTQHFRTGVSTHKPSATSGLQRLPPQPLIQAPNMSLPSPAPQAPARHIHQSYAPKPHRRQQPRAPNFSASSLQRSPVQHFRSTSRHEPVFRTSPTRPSETRTTSVPALAESGTQTREEAASVGASTQTASVTEVVRHDASVGPEYGDRELSMADKATDTTAVQQHDVSVGPDHGDQDLPLTDNPADTTAVQKHDASVGPEHGDQAISTSDKSTVTSAVELKESKSSSSRNHAQPPPRRRRGQSRHRSTSASRRSRRNHQEEEDELDVDTKHESRHHSQKRNTTRGTTRHHKYQSDRRDEGVRERNGLTRRRMRSLDRSQRRRDYDQRPHTHHSHRARSRYDDPISSTRVTATSVSSRGRYHFLSDQDDEPLFSSEEELDRPRRRRLGLAPSPSTRLGSRRDPYQPHLSDHSDLSRTYPMHTPSALPPRQFTTSRGFVASDYVSRTPSESKTTASEVAAAVAAANEKKGDDKDKEDDVALLVYIYLRRS